MTALEQIAKDMEEFRQLRQQLQPVLSDTKHRLLQRIQGYVAAGIPPALQTKKLTKKQEFQQIVNRFL